MGGWALLGGAGCLGSWAGVVDPGPGVLGVVEPVFVFVFAPGVPGVLGVLGVLGFGVRLGAVPGVGWFGFGVRLSPAPGVGWCAPGVRVLAPPGVLPLGLVTGPGVGPGTRPSVDGAGVLRGGVEGVGLGVEAGPVPVPVGLGMPGVLDGVLGVLCAGLGLVGLVLDGVLPGVVLVPVRAPVPPSAVEGEVGEVGIEELPSGRGPAVVEESAVVGAGAALDWVGMLAARLSIDVLIEPPPLVDEGVLPPVGVGADCGLGEVRPPGEDEPARLSPALGVLLLVSAVGAGDGAGDELLGVGSSKSDSVGGEGGSEAEGLCPVSELLGDESGVALPVSVLGRFPRSGAL
ncbi:hypothetical protein BGM19_05445 [Streptomyces agglomeratus]|nr:hypothetical protein BGM19_05445 [Streptomyces agglomeratus]